MWPTSACRAVRAGCAAWSADDLTELNSPCEAADYPGPSGAVPRVTRGVHENQACSACFAALVRALHATGRGVGGDIYIGQGWRGQTAGRPGHRKLLPRLRVLRGGLSARADAVARRLETRNGR